MRLVDFFKGKKKVAKSFGGSSVWWSLGGGSRDAVITAAKAMELYGTHIWVKKAVNIIANNLAKVKVILVDKEGNEVEGHPAIEILNNPNPYQNAYQFRLLTHIYAETAGESFWLAKEALIAREKFMAIRELMILRPDAVRVNAGTDTFIDNYEYSAGGHIFKYEPFKVFHMLDPDPLNPYRGLCPLSSIAYEIYSDISANKWNKGVFDNYARPDTYMIPQEEMTEDEVKAFSEAWKDKHEGAENRGKMQVLVGMKDVKTLDRTQKDVDFILSSEQYRDKILASFGVSRTIIGLNENVNRATAQAAIENFCQFTLEPRMRQFVAMLNQDFLSTFINSENLEFTYEPIVPNDVELELKEVENGIKYHYMTPDEARAKRGIEGTIEGGNKPVDTKPEPKQEKSIKAESKRDKLKKALDIKGREYEGKIFTKVVDLFDWQEAKVLKKLKLEKSITKAIKPFDMQEAVKEFITVMTPTFLDITKEEGQAALKETGEQFDVTEPDVKEAVKTQTVNFAEKVNETTENKLKDSLAEGISANENKEDLTKRVKKIFVEATTTRAKMIAETEATKAINGGRQLGFTQSDVIEKKEWITLLDGRERAAHADADGQVVAVDKAFNVGGEELEYPADPSGSAENVVNCRCRMIPIIE